MGRQLDNENHMALARDGYELLVHSFLFIHTTILITLNYGVSSLLQSVFVHNQSKDSASCWLFWS